MNSLGRDCRACAGTLCGYAVALRRLRRAAGVSGLGSRTAIELEQLLFDLDVDVGARSGERGRERMSLVEARVLQPTLAIMRDRLAVVDPRSQPSMWHPALREALRVARAALRRLRESRSTGCAGCRAATGAAADG